MLKTLNDAKAYARDRVAKIAQEAISETEKMLIATEIEELLFVRLESQLSDELFEQAQAQNSEELEAFLFHRIPNYMTLLEEITAEFLTDYLTA